ncbi:hypothetical protein HZS38_04890 [Xenorhabdus nematophila]|nr:hypothetical protein [Xenorhabdus nematophila]MBA0018532.1 hypothetical protein [Xenorhabdus nematophila]
MTAVVHIIEADNLVSACGIVFPENNVESLAEANAMLSAVLEDARKASNLEDKHDLESLQGWLEENINSQLVGAK